MGPDVFVVEILALDTRSNMDAPPHNFNTLYGSQIIRRAFFTMEIFMGKFISG